MTSLWDIHNHILPGVDDGSSCMEESMLLIEQEYKQGVRNIIVTPHYRPGKFTISSEDRADMFAELQSYVTNRYKDVSLRLGCELYIDKATQVDIKDKYNRMAGLGIVLVEFSYGVSYATMVQLLDKFRRQNIKVIIAHVERYKCLREDANRVSELRDLGYFVQVNCDAILGRNGFAVKFFTTKLLKMKLIDFVASDSHNIDKRSVRIGKAFSYVSKKYGEELAVKLFSTNANRLFGKEAE